MLPLGLDATHIRKMLCICTCSSADMVPMEVAVSSEPSAISEQSAAVVPVVALVSGGTAPSVPQLPSISPPNPAPSTTVQTGRGRIKRPVLTPAVEPVEAADVAPRSHAEPMQIAESPVVSVNAGIDVNSDVLMEDVTSGDSGARAEDVSLAYAVRTLIGPPLDYNAIDAVIGDFEVTFAQELASVSRQSNAMRKGTCVVAEDAVHFTELHGTRTGTHSLYFTCSHPPAQPPHLENIFCCIPGQTCGHRKTSTHASRRWRR